MRYKNHEGYADPTAGAALMRVSRQEKRKRTGSGRLPFRRGELESFKMCLGRMLP